MAPLIISVFLAFAVSAAAFPTSGSGLEGRFWQSSLSSQNLIDSVTKREAATIGQGLCDLSKASMPTAPTPLPSLDSGLHLSHVAIGRGTQNYTCDLSNSTSIPVNIGAVASLFNVTCLAASVPSLLSRLPSIALDLPVPTSSDPRDPANTDLSGHHYFLNTTTPFFNLNTSSHDYGTGAFKKINSTDAPTDAIKGPHGKGNGAVAWLKLTARDPQGQILQEVYRVNTAGGDAPKSCQGLDATFQVEYAAEYWVYTDKS